MKKTAAVTARFSDDAVTFGPEIARRSSSSAELEKTLKISGGIKISAGPISPTSRFRHAPGFSNRSPSRPGRGAMIRSSTTRTLKNCAAISEKLKKPTLRGRSKEAGR
ncbi:MAG: hypothetical protein R3C42_07300 [Parvularculaceae bacterium]